MKLDQKTRNKVAAFSQCAAVILLLGMGLISQPVSAHHAAAAVFTDEMIEVEGYVTEFKFNNPHISVYFNVADEQGVETQWMATGPATPSLTRQGWSQQTIQPGQYMRFRGRKARRGRPMVLVVGSELSVGEGIVQLDPGNGSVIRPVIGSLAETQSIPQESLIERTLADGRPNLTGMWLGGLQAAKTNRSELPLNVTGLALQATFDPINDPVFATCSNEPSLVRQAASILPKKITQYDALVLIEYEGFEGRREIRLDGSFPETQEHTRFGRYAARYHDGALVIETTQLLGGLTGPEGNALSDQTTTVETYRRADGSGTEPILEMTMIVTDSGHLTKPWTIITHKTPANSDYEFAAVDCELPLLGPEE